MKQKLEITVLCGGQSTEHEISILSARNVVSALNTDKYKISIIYIPRNGQWYLLSDNDAFLTQSPKKLIEQGKCQPVTVAMGNSSQPWISLNNPSLHYPVDCVIPMLHGTLGEDGAPQGLLDMLGVPYVGADVLGSSICMEKHIAKRLLRLGGIPTTDWQMICKEAMDDYDYESLSAQFGPVMFVKPVSLGSSVGISKVKNEQQYRVAIEDAFKYDDQVLIEPCIVGREIECSVLGNEEPVASLPGEIMTTHEFYSYEAKYIDPNGATTQMPAELDADMVAQIQEIAVKAFQILHCKGMARVDFFIADHDIYVNEVNTIPGFTNISMYPKLWELSGISGSELFDDLISLALARHQRQQALSLQKPAVFSSGSEQPIPEGFE